MVYIIRSTVTEST